jgi:hypothetical protein
MKALEPALTQSPRSLAGLTLYLDLCSAGRWLAVSFLPITTCIKREMTFETHEGALKMAIAKGFPGSAQLRFLQEVRSYLALCSKLLVPPVEGSFGVCLQLELLDHNSSFSTRGLDKRVVSHAGMGIPSANRDFLP